VLAAPAPTATSQQLLLSADDRGIGLQILFFPVPPDFPPPPGPRSGTLRFLAAPVEIMPTRNDRQYYYYYYYYTHSRGAVYIVVIKNKNRPARARPRSTLTVSVYRI